MTPEERASLPPQGAPWQAVLCEQIKALQHTVRAMRVHRMASEYPQGHFERDKRLPSLVKEWEDEFGPAQQSTMPICTPSVTEDSPEAIGSPQ